VTEAGKRGGPGAPDPIPDDVASAPTVAKPLGEAATVAGTRIKPRARMEIGSVLGGRYELLAELGRGAFGTVFRARDRVADEVVAIKVLELAAGGSPEAVARLRRELKTARTVTHPGVVRIHDVIDLGDRLALSMELIEGETLHARLARPPALTEAEIGALALDLARALAAAHRAGVVHRDLKPANIILRAGSGRAVVTDFGISRLSQQPDAPSSDRPAVTGGDPQLTREGEIVGTPLYMAPEQLTGSRDIGPAADVYALGVVLFEAATGTRPHATEDLPGLLSARLGKPAPGLASLRPDLSPGLCAAVDRCLATRAEDRFADGSQVRAGLEPGPSSSGAGTAILQRPRRRRRVAVVATVGLLAVAAGAVVGVNAWRGQLPTRDRRVAFVVANPGGPEDAWLGRAVAGLASRRLRDRELRVHVLDEPARANVLVKMTLRRTAGGASLEAEVGRAGGRTRPLGTVSEASLSVALDRILDRVVARVAAGQREREPDPGERAEMARLGATSFRAFRLYQQAIAIQFGTVTAASSVSEKLAEEATRLDPEWPHAHVLLAIVRGGVSPQARATVQKGREACRNAARDPVGQKLLEAMALSHEGRHAEVTETVSAAWRQSPRDLAAAWLHLVDLFGRQRSDETIALLRQVHGTHPDLQFGSDLAGALREGGRADEVGPLLDAWFANVPHNEQALVAQVARDLERGGPPAAERRVRDLVLLHGEAPHRLIALCDVLIMAGRTREARGPADRLLHGSARDRSYGRHRLGQIAISEGRFAAAYESLQEAAVEARPLGLEGETEQILDLLRTLAPVVGREADVEKLLEELGQVREALGAAGGAVAARFETALRRARGGACPALDAGLGKLAKGPAHTIARIDMQRAAAEAGCLPCSTVVGAGLSPVERGAVSAFRFGVCAEREGALRLAADAFNRVRGIPAQSLESTHRPSIYHAILARYYLGRVHERLGESAAARAEYQAFLEHWGKADRVVPQADDARAALVRLR
jgi:serine/threonine-protein kinase